MNNYEQEANVILKMTKVVHPDYVVNSIAEFLKERDTEQKLQQHNVMQAEGSDDAKGAAVGNSAAGKGVSVGSAHNYFCVKRMHKEPVCLTQCEWCKKA